MEEVVVVVELVAVVVIVAVELAEIMITTIMTLKGSNRNFLQPPHRAANCLQHAPSKGQRTVMCISRATHRALTTCYMYVKWCKEMAHL